MNLQLIKKLYIRIGLSALFLVGIHVEAQQEFIPGDATAGMRLHSYAISPDARWLMMEGAGGGKGYMDLHDKAPGIVEVTNDWHLSEDEPITAWSPDGNTVAFRAFRE